MAGMLMILFGYCHMAANKPLLTGAAGAQEVCDKDPAFAGGAASGPETQADGLLVWRIRSPYQRGETLLRALLPKKLAPPERRRVVFILPVEAGPATRWGDPLRAARAIDAADRFGLVLLFPTFSDLPWYCDHPTEPLLRQESHVLKALVPLAERLWPHDARRRGLLGFSKSGWGAFTLLLRNPDAFGAAAAWDAPMMMTRPLFGMEAIVGTLENFERYRVARLLAERAERVKRAKRLGLFGHGNFRKETQAAHALMEQLGIPHDYADGPPRKHHWESGWLEQALQALSAMLP